MSRRRRYVAVAIVASLLCVGLVGAADLDGDRLGTWAELSGSTNPLDADTDQDGLPDGTELRRLGTDPTDPDSDDDGLVDGAERRRGTDPLAADTDGDGLTDGSEVHFGGAEGRLPGADPLRMDVYLEVDSPPTCSLGGPLAAMKAAFAAAPIDNPDGSAGMTLHLVNETHGVPGPVFLLPRAGPLNDERDLRRAHFERAGSGYRYLLVVEETTTGFFGGVVNGTVVVECGTSDTVMHELGHALGLRDRLHEGIDSTAVPFSAYPSVMNYNRRGAVFQFSDGTHGQSDFDDWGYLARNMTPPETHRLPDRR